jgi:DNA replication protein DnaC
MNAPTPSFPSAFSSPSASTALHDPLPLLLRGLNLPTIAREHAEVLARAEAENWGYRRFLLHLMETETGERLRRRIERQIKESGLPGGKTLGTLDPARLPEKIRRQLPTLLDADLVRRGDNLLCFGLPGRGKSHLAAALGREWIQRHQLKVLFVPTFKLIGQLLVAKRDLKLGAALAKLAHYDVVIIDDLGYVPQGREETDVLFTFLAERYEKKSVVITSNLVFSQWDQIFKDPMTTMAAVDRLVHHAVILEFTGESQRLQAARPTAKP